MILCLLENESTVGSDAGFRTEAHVVVHVIEVLDALMNHLEETLEVVLSRGENLALDNKGVK